jgi:hypothetical protein
MFLANSKPATSPISDDARIASSRLLNGLNAASFRPLTWAAKSPE